MSRIEITNTERTKVQAGLSDQAIEAVAEEIDEVAERLLKIGARPMTRLADYVENADLAELESRGYSGQEIAEHLVQDYQSVIAGLRETISVAQEHGDEGTADDAIGMLKAKEKLLWMVTAYRG